MIYDTIHIGDMVFDSYDERWGEVLLIGGEEKNRVLTDEEDDTIILYRKMGCSGECETLARDLEFIVSKDQWKMLKEISERDIYEVRNGEIHFLGYIYHTGDDDKNCFRIVTCSLAYAPLSAKDDRAALDEVLDECKQYYKEVPPQTAFNKFLQFYNGQKPSPLPLCNADKAKERKVYVDCASLTDALPF